MMAPEELHGLHMEYEANLERALRGIVTVERGCAITRLPHRPPGGRGAVHVLQARPRERDPRPDADGARSSRCSSPGSPASRPTRPSPPAWSASRADPADAQRVRVTLPRPVGRIRVDARAVVAMASTSSWPGTTNSQRRQRLRQRDRAARGRPPGRAASSPPITDRPAAARVDGRASVASTSRAHRAVRTDRRAPAPRAGEDERAVREVGGRVRPRRTGRTSPSASAPARARWPG